MAHWCWILTAHDMVSVQHSHRNDSLYLASIQSYQQFNSRSTELSVTIFLHKYLSILVFFFRLDSHGYTVTASELACWKPMSTRPPLRAVVSDYLVPLTDFSPLCYPQSCMWRNILATSSSDDDKYGSREGYAVEKQLLRTEKGMGCPGYPGLQPSSWAQCVFLAANQRCFKQASKQAKQTKQTKTTLKPIK